MAIRTIRTGEDEVLHKTARPVTDFNERLWTLLDDMKETMYDAEGAGLAAPQVGILRRVVVVDAGEGLVELVNPQIIEAKGEQEGAEGCLSFPGEAGIVKRPMHVKVSAQDRFGKPFTVKGSGLTARAYCHELDHLDGIVYKDIASEMIDE